MKIIRLIIALLLLGLIARYGHAADTKISALPTGAALSGAEQIPAVQSAATVATTPAAIKTYVQGTVTGTGNTVLATSPALTSPSLDTPSDINLTNATALPYSAMPTQATSTVLGNASGSTAVPSALNPLAVANMMSAVLSVDTVTIANITLSGTQTVDGVALAIGQFVLVAAQTTTADNGIYVVQSGAWTRAVNFPSGYTIAQNCDLVVVVKLGTVFANTHWYVPTASGTITIGTTGFSPQQVATYASTTHSGTVKVSAGTGAATVAAAFTGTSVLNHCVSFNDATGSVADKGDVTSIKGPCAVEDANSFHLVLNNGGTPPTSNVGTMNSHSNDQWGIITGLSVATSVIVTFSSTFTNIPACTANTSQASTPVNVSAISATAVTFNFAALTGSLYFICLGTN